MLTEVGGSSKYWMYSAALDWVSQGMAAAASQDIVEGTGTVETESPVVCLEKPGMAGSQVFDRSRGQGAGPDPWPVPSLAGNPFACSDVLLAS